MWVDAVTFRQDDVVVAADSNVRYGSPEAGAVESVSTMSTSQLLLTTCSEGVLQEGSSFGLRTDNIDLAITGCS